MQFATEAFQFVFETTTLSPESFVQFVSVTGRIPAALGLHSFTLDLNQATSGLNVNHRQAANWLMSWAIVYGALPRLILAIGCWLYWSRRRNSLKLDTSDAYFRKLLNRFEEMRGSTIVDPERRPEGQPYEQSIVLKQAPSGPSMVVGFELSPDLPWPPAGLEGSPALTLRILGSSAERCMVLDLAAREAPGKVLLVCDGATSPDRGTERFIRDMTAGGSSLALLLIRPDNMRETNPGRWMDWLKASSLDRVEVFVDAAKANGWGAQARV